MLWTAALNSRNQTPTGLLYPRREEREIMLGAYAYNVSGAYFVHFSNKKISNDL